MSIFFFLIGPAGSGKSTIGKKIMKKLKFQFLDGVNFHSSANVNKMKKGIKLKYKDRLPWLIKINKKLKKHNNSKSKYIIACSALKKKYRKILSKDLNKVFFFYLKCKKSEIIKRVISRKHFFNLSLINDQIINFQNSKDLINIDANKDVRKVTKLVAYKIEKYLNK